MSTAIEPSELPENDMAQSATEALNQAILRILDLANQHQTSGQLQKAAECYQLILQNVPAHEEANYQLGLILSRSDQPIDAIPYIECAIQANPTCDSYWNSYLSLLQLAGDDQLIEQAIALRSEFIPDIASEFSQKQDSNLNNAETSHGKDSKSTSTGLGDQFYQRFCKLYDGGRHAELEQLARRVGKKPSTSGIAHRFLGISLLDRGLIKQALPVMQKAVQILPNDAIAHFNLGLCYSQLKNYPLAESCYRQAIQCNPDMLEAYNNLGNLLTALNKVDEAIECFSVLIAKAPQFILGHLNLSNAFKQSNRLDEAKREAKIAVQMAPDFAEAHNTLGGVLYLMGEYSLGQSHLEKAISLKPDYAEAHNNLGSLFFQVADYVHAKPYFERAIALAPTLSSAYRCLANCYMFTADSVEKAELYLRKALELNPKDDVANNSLLFLLAEKGDLSPQALFVEHCRFGERFESDLKPFWPKHTNNKSPNRRLKIGFVSGDFCNHAVATFFLPILKALFQLQTVYLLAYDNNANDDDVTAIFRQNFHEWNVIKDIPDNDVMTMVMKDEVDILFDLSGHTSKNRLPLFAHKPAPIQIGWIGYPGTSGLTAIDYFIADPFLAPLGKLDDQFTEKICRLPANAAYEPSSYAPIVQGLPALKNGFVTFGSFNRSGKINSATIDLWCRVMNAVPNSHMFLGGMPQGGIPDFIVDAFEKNGIHRDRLQFYGRTTIGKYLELHQLVDMCLDTFPYGGGTTTHHALWMGVPTLTIAGNTLAAMSGACLMAQVGCQNFVAKDEVDFFNLALHWCNHLEDLANLRITLRDRSARAIKCRPVDLAECLQRALRHMWQRYCDGLPPETFEICE